MRVTPESVTVFEEQEKRSAIICRFHRLVPGAAEHRKSRIFREAGISGRTLAEVEGRSAVRLNAAHELASRTQPNSNTRTFRRFFPHGSRIAARTRKAQRSLLQRAIAMASWLAE